MKRTYIGIIEKDEQSDIGIRFPDFPGCVSAEATVADLIMSATEGLNLHIKGMLEDKDLIPLPTSVGNIVLGEGKGQQLMYITATWEAI